MTSDAEWLLKLQRTRYEALVEASRMTPAVLRNRIAREKRWLELEQAQVDYARRAAE